MPGNSPNPASSFSPHDVTAERDLLSAAAREAGALALKMQRQGLRRLHKEDGSPVTDADIAVNDLLEIRLRSQRPDYAWLSEESPDSTERFSAPRTFIVDPIDGTADFVKGNARWCVALALLDKDRLIASVIYNPMTDELFGAALGQGAACNGHAIQVSGARALAGCRMFASQHFHLDSWPKPWPDMQVMMGGSCGQRMADIAAGRADAYLSITTKWDWDMAPGALLITEAGGAVSDTQGASFRYNSEVSRQLSIAAAPAPLHAQIIERTRRISLPLQMLSKTRVQLEPED